jgi:PKHD-type hydroxylase
MRQAWQMWQSQISPEECDKIIEQFRQLPPQGAQTFNNEGQLEDNPYRQSNVRWVDDSNIRNMLWWYAQEANRLAFGFDVTDAGSIQFTEYSSEYSGKYDWHHDVDWQSDAAFDRKISVVLQLSDGNYYEGCNFEFDEVQNPDPDALRTKGTIICFPSYLRHRVTEITKGSRYSLVAWFEGPRWR